MNATIEIKTPPAVSSMRLLGRVLVACEYSGRVRAAFAARGWDTWSCDILPTETPGQHRQGDVKNILNEEWDIIIAFPPCTHLSSSGALYWPQKQKDGRQQAALDFVMMLANHSAKHIAIENPVGILSRLWRKPDQIIEPHHHGDPYRKKTCLWLKNLPLLTPSKPVTPVGHWHHGAHFGGRRKDGTRKIGSYAGGMAHSAKERSKTFCGIAEAMANQWTLATRPNDKPSGAPQKSQPTKSTR